MSSEEIGTGSRRHPRIPAKHHASKVSAKLIVHKAGQTGPGPASVSDIPVLEKLTSLQRLYLSPGSISQAQIDALKSALPRLDVIERR
jgi:hypothetical protein